MKHYYPNILSAAIALCATALMAALVIACDTDTEDVATTQPQPTDTPEIVATEPPSPTPEPTIDTTPYWAKLSATDAADELMPLESRTDFELVNTQEWLNGDPTTITALRDSGEVVLVDFWTYT